MTAGHPLDTHGRAIRKEPNAMPDPDAAPNKPPTHYGQGQDLRFLHQSTGDFRGDADVFLFRQMGDPGVSNAVTVGYLFTTQHDRA